MEYIYNFKTLIFFLGGICTFFLPVIIKISYREVERKIERKKLTVLKQTQPEIVGDVEEKLNNSSGFERINFFESITFYALQPLFIISFINLFDLPSPFEIMMVFILLLFIIVHEFWSGELFSKRRFYQFIIIAFWLTLYLMICHRENIKEINLQGKIETHKLIDSKVDSTK